MPQIRTTWTRQTEGRLGGLALAREAGLLLAWDEGQSLYLWNEQGEEKARQRLRTPVCGAAASDDGSQFAAIGKGGELWWLNKQLELQFDQRVKDRPLAVAVEPLGRYIAVSARDRRTDVFTRQGKHVWRAETPRALHFLQFLSGSALLVGAADHGYAACFNTQGRRAWQDGFVAHVGGMSAAADGGDVYLACFSSGLRRLRASGKQHDFTPTPRPVRLVAVDFDAQLFLTAGEAPSLSLLNSAAQVITETPIPCAASALVLGALGNFGAFGKAEGEVTALEIAGAR